MPDLIDDDPLQKFMALFVGPNGSGKSIAIASWIEEGSVYCFDYDGRMASVANWLKSKGLLKRGQFTYDTYGPQNIYEAYMKLKGWVDNGCPYNAVSLDSFTAMTVSAVTFSLSRRIYKGGQEAPKNSKGDMILPDWDEWNGEATYITFMLDLCKSLASKGVKIFWTAHPVARTKIDAGGGGGIGKVTVQTKYAAFGTKSDSLIPIYFNEIYYFTTDWDMQAAKAKRVCFTQPSGEVAAKTSLNIPAVIDWTDQSFHELFVKAVKAGGSSSLVKEGENINEVKLTEF